LPDISPVREREVLISSIKQADQQKGYSKLLPEVPLFLADLPSLEELVGLLPLEEL
jgi:hypothetical protein